MSNGNIPPKRKYDIVLYGATGYTGKYAAKYLAKRVNDSALNIGIAGRNETKLNALKKTLYKGGNIDVIKADSKNENELRDMIKDTIVLVSCVGPFRLYGELIVKLCAELGTHYTDICGEPDFIERMAFKYYDMAKNSGAIIVSACGFDSIPADMGHMYLSQYYKNIGAECAEMNAYHTGKFPKGYSINVGTLFSLVNSMSNIGELKKLRKQTESVTWKTSKKLLNRIGNKLRVNFKPMFYSKESKRYSFVFQGADSAVVTNSQGINNALLDSQGIKTVYQPYFACYLSFNAKYQIQKILLVGSIFITLLKYNFGKTLIQTFPSIFTLGAFSYNGPSDAQKKAASFKTQFFSKGYSKKVLNKYVNNKEDITNNEKMDMNIRLTIGGNDPAYIDTSKMLIECSLCLINDINEIKHGNISKNIPGIEGGVFTPSVVFQNTKLIDNLIKNGMIWDIWDVNDPSNKNKDNNLSPTNNPYEWLFTKTSLIIIILFGLILYKLIF